MSFNFLEGGLLFQLRLNYAWRGQVTSEPKRGKITKQRRTPHMPATDKKKRTTMGVERARYTRAKEKSGGARFQRKMGTTECTTAAPILVDSFLKPRLVASSGKY